MVCIFYFDSYIMIKSYRTKRRKIQKDLILLNESQSIVHQNLNETIINTSEINSALVNSSLLLTSNNKNQPVEDPFYYNDVLVQINDNSSVYKNTEKISDTNNCSNTIKSNVDECSINNEKEPLHVKLKN